MEVGQGRPILFLHGNPTWSYVWRHILPIVAEQGRAIAVDLVRMGRSSKPEILYRFADHSAYVDAFIQHLGLRNLTLVLHDWGSALGFHYACRHPDNVRAMAFFEAILTPIPSWGALPRQLREMFQSFRNPELGCQLIIEQNMFVEKVLPAGISRALTDERAVDWCRRSLPNLTTVNLGKGLHYLQEDHPEFIGRSIASWLRTFD